MIEAYGDIWKNLKDYDAVVITTNGFVKKNGEAVMGRGIALAAKTKYPRLATDLGSMLNKHGNFVFGFRYKENPFWIITMPVKPEFGPGGIPGWKARADIDLIRESAKQIVGLPPYYGLFHNINDSDSEGKLDRIIMPRPGCGNGGLKWETVKPVIEPILDDRFTVMERNERSLNF